MFNILMCLFLKKKESHKQVLTIIIFSPKKTIIIFD